MVKQNFLTRTLLLFALIVGSTSVWADYEPVYTLDCEKNSKASDYTKTFDVTINGLIWNAPGNQNLDGGWRIGGKSISDAVDRVITGKSAMTDEVTKVTFNHMGKSRANVSVPYVKLTVASDEDFENVIDEVIVTEPTITKDTEGSFDFIPTSPLTKWNNGYYYKITINVSNSDNSNGGLNVTSIVFYKTVADKIATITTIDYSGITNTDVYTSSSAGKLTASVKAGDADVEDAIVTWTSSNESVASVNANGEVTLNKAGSATITATYEGDDTYRNSSDSYELTVTDSNPDKPLFYEGVSGYTGTTDGSSTLSTTYTNLDSDNWESFTKVSNGKKIEGRDNGCLKFGSSSDNGVAKTNAINLTGNGILTFEVMQYKEGETGPMTITATGATLTGETSVSGTSEFTKHTVYLTDCTGEVVLTFTSTGRLYLDEITLVQATKVSITTSKDYATYAAPFALDFSEVEGLEALVVNKVNEATVSTEAVTAVPAGVGIVLHKTGEVTTFKVPIVASAAKPAKNYLVGVLEATEIGGNGTDYVLKNGVFHKASAGTLAAGKAYLKAEVGQAPTLSFDGGEGTTGIQSIDNGQLIMNNVYYDLSGRRISQPTKGLYIVNGKKVIIK